MHRGLLLLLMILASQPAAAQRSVRLVIGATKSGDLAHDAVIDNTILALAVAPTVTAGLALPISKSGNFRAVFEGSYSTSQLTVTDTSVSRASLGKVATLSTSAMLDGRLGGALRWQAGVGALFYMPAENAGVFLKGGTHRYLIGGGMSWSHPLTSTIDLLALGRYSFHEFTTPTLTSRGYSSFQSVHRFGIQVGVERRF